MNDTTAQKPEALSRTWAAVIEDRAYSEVWGVRRHTVTLSRAYVGAPMTAEVDGEAADFEEAVRLLARAEVLTLTAEVLAPLPAPTIGKARAAKFHRILGRFGLPSAYHYRAASDALGREVASLAALTEEEARRVWAFLRRLFPTIEGAAA